MPGGWVVYILICSDGTFYTGVTTNVARRLMMHNRGTASRYTRGRRPCLVGWVSSLMPKSEAHREEHRIKRLPRADKEFLCESVLSGVPSRS